jgi:hypothetical protein
MKTFGLTGPALDWAVHTALIGAPCVGYAAHEYSTDWAQGGPIIEREEICVLAPVRGLWRSRSSINMGRTHYGPTPLIAAMRCYVASKLGDEVEIPQELL